jgi:hypothetical protein
LLNDLFARAERIAAHGLLCYVNADIVLSSDLLNAIAVVRPERHRALITCTPIDMPMEEVLETGHQDWEDRLRSRAFRDGRPPSRFGADVFVFPKGYYRKVPPLLIGKAWWDTWLIGEGCRKLAGVDVTPFCLAIHQRHRHSTHTDDFDYESEDVAYNFQHLRWFERHCGRTDLPYELTREGRLVRRYANLWIGTRGRMARRQLATLEMRLLERTYLLRRRIRLYRWWKYPVLRC